MTYYEAQYKRNEIEFGVNTIADLDAVVNAAKWIDNHRAQLHMPLNWRDMINPHTLAMTDPESCVLGQLGKYNEESALRIDVAEDEGALTPYVFCSSEITPTWKEYFHAHRLATHA